MLNANYKCQFKAFTQVVEDDEQKIDGIPIAFDNFKDGITRVSLKKDDSFKLFISLPTETFGVMMFYKKGTTKDNVITLTADGTLEQLNSETSTGTKTLEMGTDGIYVMRLDKAITNIKVSTSGDGTSNLFFSNLDIVPNQNSLNPQLGLEQTDYDNVMKKIKEYDSSNKFYYNYITDSSTLINFNNDDSTETLMTSDI